MERGQFERLALEHLDSVHRMAMKLARRQDDAADLVQETYLRALRSSERFEERQGGMRPWLFTILHNIHRTRLKRESRAPIAVEAFYEADERDTIPGEPPPAWNLSAFDWEHVDGRLKQAVEELKPEYQVVLLLWGVEGLKYREIAGILDLPIGTVMSRLFRIRKTLATALEEMREELGIRVSETES